jgi:hypothetical protein
MGNIFGSVMLIWFVAIGLLGLRGILWATGALRGPSPGVSAWAIAARTRTQYLGALAAQFLHACADHRKVVSGAGSGHVSSVYHCEPKPSAVDYTAWNRTSRQC